MKKLTALVLFAAMIASVLAGCGTGGNQDGGTSNGLTGTVTTNGSTSMEKVILILNEQFGLDNPGVKVSYDPTGSGTGVEAAKTGTADIGLTSRALKEEEKAEGLKETVLALDGIAVIVNQSNPVFDLTMEQIAGLFTGEIASWSELGGSGAVACIGREGGSGTREGFESITGTEDHCVLAQELTSTGAVIEAVRNNPQAIGYASLSSVEGKEGIKAITVGGVACTEDTVKDGSYAIQRPFVLVTKEDEALSEAAQAYFDWATSAAAADLIRAGGAVPLA